MNVMLTGGAGRRWVAAAAAVLVVAAVVLTVRAAVGQPGRPYPAARSRPAPIPMPPFYLYSGTGSDGPGVGATRLLAVRSSATNQVLDTVRAPAGHWYGGFMAAAADDRAFLLNESGDSARTSQVTSFELLRLTAPGRVASLTRVPFTVSRGRHDYFPVNPVLNAQGTQFAVVIEPPGSNPQYGANPGITRVVIVSVASGQVLRSWTASGFVQVNALSWTSHGRLALTVEDERQPPPAQAVMQLREIAVISPSGPLLTTSRVFRLLVAPGQTLTTAQLTPDGRRVIAWVSHNQGDVDRHVLQEYSAATGRLERTLYDPQRDRGLRVFDPEPDRHILNQVWPAAIDPSGQHLLIQGMNTYGGVIIGRVDDGRFTRLPGGRANDAEVLLPITTW
jgi:hypothetical protein